MSPWQIFVVVATLLGVLTGVLSLLPKLSISSSGPLNPKSAFTTPFTLSNEGFLSIMSVNIFCAIREAKFEGDREIIGTEDYRSRFTTPDHAAAELKPDEKYTFSCAFLFNEDAPLIKADIAIIISYRPAWVPWRQEKVSRFVTKKSSDGRLHWFSQPISK